MSDEWVVPGRLTRELVVPGRLTLYFKINIITTIAFIHERRFFHFHNQSIIVPSQLTSIITVSKLCITKIKSG